MRTVIVATLALTPMLLHAQANPPAQTQTSSPSSSTLQSKLVQPKEFDASEADHSVAHVATPVRISTGVVAPKLIHTIAIESDSSFREGFAIDRKTVVEMVVDATGKPSDLKIAQSLGPVMDQ